MTALFYYLIFCPCSIRFCRMIHDGACLCALLSNHFYNTHNPHILGTLTPAGLKSTESCILVVVKVCCLGSYCTPHKFYIIIFMIFASPYLGNYTWEQLQICLLSLDRESIHSSKSFKFTGQWQNGFLTRFTAPPYSIH